MSKAPELKKIDDFYLKELERLYIASIGIKDFACAVHLLDKIRTTKLYIARPDEEKDDKDKK